MWIYSGASTLSYGAIGNRYILLNDETKKQEKNLWNNFVLDIRYLVATDRDFWEKINKDYLPYPTVYWEFPGCST